MKANKIPVKDLYLGELVEFTEKSEIFGEVEIKQHEEGWIPFLKYADIDGFVYGEDALTIFGPERYYERVLYQIEENPNIDVYLEQKQYVKQQGFPQGCIDYVRANTLTSTNYGLSMERQKVSVSKFLKNPVKLFPNRSGYITEEELVDYLTFMNLKMADVFKYRATYYLEKNKNTPEKRKTLQIKNGN